MRTMPTVVSRDGAPISFATRGHGPPLVLVHGTASSALRWGSVLGILERTFTLHVVDRRGRGESGDGAHYSLAREVDDVSAVLASLAEPAFVLGHSFGGLVALEHVLTRDAVRGLAVYEPPVPAFGPIYADAVIEEFDALLAAGDREGVITSFFTKVLGLDEATLAREKMQPSWTSRVAAAHTLPREARATNAYAWEPARFASMRIPTRVFLGGESHPFVAKLMKVVSAAIEGSDLVVLPGQKHVAMDTAPDLFAKEIERSFVSR